MRYILVVKNINNNSNGNTFLLVFFHAYCFFCQLESARFVALRQSNQGLSVPAAGLADFLAHGES